MLFFLKSKRAADKRSLTSQWQPIGGMRFPLSTVRIGVSHIDDPAMCSRSLAGKRRFCLFDAGLAARAARTRSQPSLCEKLADRTARTRATRRSRSPCVPLDQGP